MIVHRAYDSIYDNYYPLFTLYTKTMINTISKIYHKWGIKFDAYCENWEIVTLRHPRGETVKHEWIADRITKVWYDIWKEWKRKHLDREISEECEFEPHLPHSY